MTAPARRFTDKPELDPTSVLSLAPSHAAMVGNRTLFPSTVVTVTAGEPDRLLVSGRNNRKLGDVVAKGRFKGYALYGLSLEERATCPTDCGVRAFCYGNSMQLARRHRIGDADVFFDRLGAEIVSLLDEHDGLLVRLHVLGDFPSVEYVAFWSDALAENDRLAVYGYTHRRAKVWDGDEIGDAIQSLKDKYPDRFRIRWSGSVSRSDGAVVINKVPRQPRVDEGLVCPAQAEATACCASCGLCWEPAAKNDTIVFIKHGPHSGDVAAAHEMAKHDLSDLLRPEIRERADAARSGRPLPPIVKTPQKHIEKASKTPAVQNVPNVHSGTLETATRPIAAIELPAKLKPNVVATAAPAVRLVAPTDLRIEAAYQRDLSGKSIKLIRRIVENWDWSKFKPPICAETADGLFVIDGQHTAIAAASHGSIRQIPVLIVDAATIARRADSFVAHNRDRLAMSPLQVFHAEMAAGNGVACRLYKIATAEGATIPRSIPAPGYERAGQLTPIAELRRALITDGDKKFARVVRILVTSGIVPIPVILLRAVRKVLSHDGFVALADRSDATIAQALKSLHSPKLPLDMRARQHAHKTGLKRDRACALLIAEAAGVSVAAEAA